MRGRNPQIAFIIHRHVVSKTYAISLMKTHDIPWVASPTCETSLKNGFAKRMNPLMPVANRQTLLLLQQFVQRYLNQYKPLPNMEHEEKHLVEQWLLDNEHYTLRKKKKMLRDYDYISRFGIPILVESDYDCKSFIKREFYPEAKYPRFINSRSDRFKVRVGYAIKMIEKIIYSGNTAFVKGVNPNLLPPLIKNKLQNYPYLLETDYSSFEGGFSLAYSAAVEMQLWRHFLVNNPNLRRDVLHTYYQPYSNMARCQRIRNDIYDGYVNGSRMSGEMWTSLGNGFSNLMNILFWAEQNHQTVDCFVEGDDAIIGMNTPFYTEQMFTQLGFKIKMKYVTSLIDTSFCGNIFHPDECLTIIEPENITRLFWTCHPSYLGCCNEKKVDLLRAKAMSLFVLARDTPIAGNLAYKVLQIIGPGSILVDPNQRWWENQILKLFHTIKFVKPVITDKSRFLYARNFHITIARQLKMERIIDKAVTLQDFESLDSFIETQNVSSAVML